MLMRKFVIASLLGVTAILVITAYHISEFFVHANKPAQSDAVILFMGSEDSRNREARRLIDEGYARYLIVPAVRQVFTPENIHAKGIHVPQPLASKVFSKYPSFYEKTHIEALYAREVMKTMGLTSAIMVSSPYHMIRIRIIAGKTFGDQARFIRYVPTKSERVPAGLQIVHRGVLEFIKICWFRLYSPFIDTT
jgi:hypothetical protein